MNSTLGHSEHKDGIGLAFGLTIGAGACTCLGAALSGFTSLNSHLFLAGAMSMSAGVMIYVSLVEILAMESVQKFKEAGYDEAVSIRYATFCFFAGALVTHLLDVLLVTLSALYRSKSSAQQVNSIPTHNLEVTNTEIIESTSVEIEGITQESDDDIQEVRGDDGQHLQAHPPAIIEVSTSPGSKEECSLQSEDTSIKNQILEPVFFQHNPEELLRMGLFSAVVIFLHNIPEGIATYVSTIADPRSGATIAFAIAMHNIPEGIIVSVPIFYATGSRWKGLVWATVSGIAEPFGALIGFAALSGSDSDLNPLAYGMMFAMVSGIMVFISLCELFPTAVRNDPGDRIIKPALFGGMAIMASSILLFEA